MSWFGDNSENESSDGEEGGEDDYKTFEDQIMFLIDARESMGATNQLGEVHLINSLKRRLIKLP